jgi:GNAT superfamily N-acetyltransferase
LPEFLGRGLGKHLLTQAVQTAWGLGAARVWLHTCTLDDPAALPNYLARGFRPFKTDVYSLA